MTAIALLSGIAATETADFAISYPVNLEPVTLKTGLSSGYLRSAAGARQTGSGPGNDRGAIVWNGVIYRVMGSKLVSISGTVATSLGDVGDGDPVGLQYGINQLAIQSGTSLYFWDGKALVQVTDTDLGACNDIVWFKGQYFSTDGTYVVALQLADPTQVDPGKYQASDTDPDPITGLGVLRNELVAFNAATIDFFNYVGGTGFPLALNEGASIPVGCVGPRAKCLYVQTYAFVGAGRNQANAVWLMGAGTASKISTRAIDDMLAAELNPQNIRLESRVSRDEHRLYVHLSDRTLVYLKTASDAAQQPVWYVARSGRGADQPYRLRNAVLLNGAWNVGDVSSGAFGVLGEAIAGHFGELEGWSFATEFTYNAANGGILHELELVGLPGRGVDGDPAAFVAFTTDGETWTREKAARIGKKGQRDKRLAWRPHYRFSRYMGMRFRGDSTGLVGFAVLEGAFEGLAR